jgi:TPR repeat protein
MPPASTPEDALAIKTPALPPSEAALDPTAEPPTPKRPVPLRLPAAEIAALVARGDALFARGDVSSARLFYERAADAGEGRAALKLGNTFDPVFLEFAHLRMQGDPAMAESWYRRARELGETEAEILLTAAHRHHQHEVTAAQHKILPGERAE